MNEKHLPTLNPGDSHMESLIDAAIQGHADTRDAMRWLVRQLVPATQPAEVTDEQIAACVKRASTYGLPFVGLLNPGGTPSDFSKRFTAEILALRPVQSGLTGCNCRWDGDTQVQWCELHLAHKEAIHEWAERAKEAEKQLALRPAAVPMTDEVFDLICNAIDKADTISMEGDYMLDSDDCIAVVRVMQALLSAHHGITAQAKKEDA